MALSASQLQKGEKQLAVVSCANFAPELLCFCSKIALKRSKKNAKKGKIAIYSSKVGKKNAKKGKIAIYSGKIGSENAKKGKIAIYNDQIAEKNAKNGQIGKLEFEKESSVFALKSSTKTLKLR